MSETSECKHEWQPAHDLARGRYRCVKCKALGYKLSNSNKVTEYRSAPPSWVTEQLADTEFESFYTMHESGRCPTMDEQEHQLFDEPEQEDEYR